MPRANEPLDMLRKCREHFSAEAAQYEAAAIKAGSEWESNVAREFGGEARRFVDAIDATLRDWA